MLIYVLIVLVGSVIAGRLILGELRKERRDYVVLTKPAVTGPVPAPAVPSPASSTAASLKVKNEPVPISVEEFKKSQAEFISPVAQTPFVKVEKQTERKDNWESILAFKNAEIERLTKDLEAQRYQTQEIEKIKALLERQIFESRQMSRATKREFELLKAQGQKSQDEITKLQMELNYKNQLINQSEMRMSELKNRISQLLPNTPASGETGPEPVQKQDLGEFSFDQLDWRKKLNE